MSDLRKICRGKSKEHADAGRLVEYLMDEGGSTASSNPDVAAALGFTRRVGRLIEVDMPRFYKARNHVKDRVWKEDGRPCCGFRLHYREIKGKTHWALIDPTGDFGVLALAAVGDLRGWMTRERQHQTESLRQIVSVEAIADHALTHGDKAGYRLCQTAIIELSDIGTIKPATMAELSVWAEGIGY